MVVNMKKSKILIITSWTAVILWMLVIFCFSAQNADQSSGTSGGFAKFLAKILYRDFNTIDKPSQDILINKCQFIVRKTAHFTVYATLGILTYMAVRISKFKFSYLISSVICLAYAVSDEIHQYYRFFRFRSGNHINCYYINFFQKYQSKKLNSLILKNS